MDLIKTSGEYALDRDTWQFISCRDLSHGFELEIPFYEWNYGVQDIIPNMRSAAIGNGTFTAKRAKKIKLNGFTIECSNGYKNAIIIIEGVGNIAMITSPIMAQFGTVMSGADLKISKDGEGARAYFSQLKYFEWVMGLHSFRCGDPISEKFSYGLPNYQLEVSFRGHILNGKSYAFICGPWAILLSDDMKFDSIALLSGVRYRRLYVDKFVYTVNKYIVKCMTMLKQEG